MLLLLKNERKHRVELPPTAQYDTIW